jgi:TPR repeat protein
VIYECGDKDLPLAKRWYKAAAAQGHVAARSALAALEAPLPTDAREREIADIRRDMNCVGRLQENANDANLENDNRAKEADQAHQTRVEPPRRELWAAPTLRPPRR